MYNNFNGGFINPDALDALIEPAVVIDGLGEIAAVNRSWLAAPVHGGESLPTYPGVKIPVLFEDHPALMAGIEQVLAGRLPLYRYEWSGEASGGKFIYEVRVTPLRAPASAITGALLIFFELTEQRERTEILATESERYRLIVNHSKDMIKVVDIRGKVEYASPSHRSVLGYDRVTDIFNYIHPEDAGRFRDMCQEIRETKKSRVREFRKQHNDGYWVWVETIGSPVLSAGGSVKSILIISRDISERKKLQHELEQMAYHDHLTGLYNRRKMKGIMEEALRHCQSRNDRFALLIMDLDHFKKINDTYGHDGGDLVLQQFASRLLACKTDKDVVGRLSGDEFSVVLKGIKGKEEVDAFIARFHQALEEPYLIPEANGGIYVRSSVGFALYPDHGSTVSLLFKHADLALYREKSKRVGWFRRLFRI